MEQQAKLMQRKPLLVFLFHFLLFSYPLLSFLWRRSYPFFTAEVGTLFLSLALFCIVLVGVFNHVRPLISSLLSALLVTVVMVLQFDLVFPGVIVCAVLSLIAAGCLQGRFPHYGLPVLMALILGAYFDSTATDGGLRPAGESTDVNSALPPIVHILLDSFIGLDGLPSYTPSKMLSDELYTFFGQYEFHLFPRAYSRFMRTGDSLYSAMNFRNDGNSIFSLEVMGRRKHVLTSNALFDSMQKLGYGFNIYQTEYLDFCQSNREFLARCWTYSQPNVGSIQHATKFHLRLGMLAQVLLGQSTLLSDLIAAGGWQLEQGVAYHDPRVFTELENDLLAKSVGRYFFVHVLLPHGPFAFMHDCTINYDAPIWSRYAGSAMEPVPSDAVAEIRTMKYFEQVDCALISVQKIFEKMKNAGIYERSIIVIHGDHGSLIGKYFPEYKNLGLLTTADYRANFSTLFAVKFPGEAGQIDRRTLALSTLLKGFSEAVQGYVTGQHPVAGMRTLTDAQDPVAPYVFLQGTYPMQRVEVQLFDD